MMPRIFTNHVATDAFVRPAATQELATSKLGKGTTSVVPFSSTMDAALAAEGRLDHLDAGSRFTI